jgi:cysteine-rich repeat protein
MRLHRPSLWMVSGALIGLLASGCAEDGDTGAGPGGTSGDGGGGPGGTSTTTSTSTGTTTSTTTTSSSTTGPGGGGGAGGAEPVCGDGNVDDGEECDDGVDNADTAACKSDCTDQACGDGFVGPAEECDEGADNADTAACKSDCTSQACGDGFVGPGEECDSGAANADTAACKSDCTSQVCGDGFVGPGESCDDGNMVDNDACTNACVSASCGDGLTQPGEQCDDGNMVNADGCTNACTTPACGDSIVQMGEQCDLGGANSNNGACKVNCQNQVCGDGFTGPGEGCDDGDAVNGNGCNNNCVVSGSPVWTMSFAGNANLDDYASGVAVDPSGNAIVAGTTTVPGQGANAWVTKYSPAGAVIWSGTYNSPTNLDDEAFGVATDVAGNIFVVGYETYAANDQDVWVRRYAPDGTIVWTQMFTSAGTATDVGYAIATDAAGNVFVTGNVSIVNQGTDIWAAKLNPTTGAIVWQQTVNTGPNLNDLGYGIAVDGNGDLVVTGGAANGSFFDVWVRKLGGAAGATLWTQTYGTAPYNDIGFAVAIDSGNNPLVVGTEFGPGQDFNSWARKYTSNGATTWTQTYNNSVANGSDSIFGVDTDAANNVVVAGRETVGGQAFNVWVRKYGPSGNTLWTQSYGGASNLDDFAAGVAVDANGNAVVAGTETVAGQGANVWIRKYAP